MKSTYFRLLNLIIKELVMSFQPNNPYRNQNWTSLDFPRDNLSTKTISLASSNVKSENS